MYYKIICATEESECEYHFLKRTPAFSTAKELKSSGKYDTVNVQLVDGEDEILDEWTI